MALTGQRLTAEEYLALPPDDCFTQLIDGEIVVNQPALRHQILATYITECLAALTDIACQVPQFITLDPDPYPVELLTSVNAQLTGRLKRLNGSTLADLGTIVSVNATGGIEHTTPTSPQDFLHPSEFGVPRRVGSSPLSAAELTAFQTGDVQLLNGDFSSVFSLLSGPASTLVNDALSDLDDQLVGPLDQMLGLTVGGADLTAISDSLKCQALRLAE